MLRSESFVKFHEPLLQVLCHQGMKWSSVSRRKCQNLEPRNRGHVSGSARTWDQGTGDITEDGYNIFFYGELMIAFYWFLQPYMLMKLLAIREVRREFGHNL